MFTKRLSRASPQADICLWMLRTRSLPRLAPSTVRRPRLERWLASHSAIPVRLIVAPAGSGKTTLLLRYLPNSTIDAAYCALEPACTPAQLFGLIAGALALRTIPTTLGALVDTLHATIREPLELVVDDVDNATPEAISVLRRLVEEAPEVLSFIYTSRSRDAIDAKSWVARGLAVLCDTERLAFDASEAELLAEACGVPHTRNEVGRLLEESDGWAIVVSGAIRSAAEDSRSLSDAFENWRTRYGQVFTEFIAADLDRAREEDRALVRSLIAGASCDDERRLQSLEAQGLFVIHEGDHYRPFRPVRQLRGGRARLAPSASLAPLVVRMFGRFEARIENQEVPWVRRRDQQLVKYLLLKPNGAATRAELATVFWPEADKHLAAQSVRTACSNIRKAIASIVGYACVDLYFRSDPDVSLDLSNVVADVRRFTAHVNDGDAAYDRGDLDEAGVHYRAAEELCTGALLEGDVPEPWFAREALVLEERHLVLLERMAEAAFESNDMRTAAEYAHRVQRLRPGHPGISRLLGQLPQQYRGTGNVTPLDETRRNRSSA